MPRAFDLLIGLVSIEFPWQSGERPPNKKPVAPAIAKKLKGRRGDSRLLLTENVYPNQSDSPPKVADRSLWR